MSRTREVLASPPIILLVIAVLLYAVAVVAAPETMLRLTTHEGPIEHAGHLVFAAAVAAWGYLAAACWRSGERTGPGAKGVALAAALYLLIALLDDLDWGAVYGIDLGYTWVSGLTGGVPNFHNAQSSHSGMLDWALVWMMVPWVAFFAASLIPVARIRQRWDRLRPVRPTWTESVQFFLIAFVTLIMDSLRLLERSLDRIPEESTPLDPLGYFQIVSFVLWGSVALRALRELRADAAEGAQVGAER